MVPMQPERQSLSNCLAQILSGERHTVSFDHLVPLRRASAEGVAEALQPWMQRLQAGDIEDVHKVWLSLEKNILLLCDFTMGEWSDLENEILAVAREALAPRSSALVDQQLLRLQDFRRDPLSSSTALESSRFSEILSEFPEWKDKVRIFFQESQDRYKADCSRTLEVTKGAQFAEVWANRLAFSIEIELVIDQHCPNPRSFASTCAQTWLHYSLPALPWILFWLLLPAMNDSGNSAAMTSLAKVRKALEHCDAVEALVQLRDAFVNACSLLLRTAWCQAGTDYAEAVSWLSSALMVTHDACQILLPDLPPSAVAAALAAIPLDVQPLSPPWEMQPVTFADFVAPKMEDLSQALAQALHEEVKHWQGEGGHCGPCDDPSWPGKMAPLLLLFRLLPNAGGAATEAQARLVALRALQGEEEAQHLERRLLSFLQNECGYQHPTLRHLAKVLQATSDGETSASSNFRAVAIPAVAACNLGLSDVQIDLNGDAGQSSGLSLLGHFPQLSLSSASKVICSQQVEWAERYFARYPHRRLHWTALGAVELLWKHRTGQTLLITTEQQAHLLLALDAFDDLVESMASMASELQPLLGPQAPLERCDDGWRLRAQTPAERLDLRVVPETAKAEAQELGARSREAHTAPVVDAALVRILKRFHVLTGEEMLQKLSNYPESLEAKLEQSPFAAFSDARAAAQDGGREAFHRLCALCDRGLLRAETLEVAGVNGVSASSGDFLQRRFFYET